MNIALVRARYNPSGGAERFAERALCALAEQDAAVSIIARSWSGPVQNDSGATILTCDPFYLGSVWRDWSFARAVRRLVGELHFDLVQSHERIPGLDIYRAGDGVHAAWLERRRVAAGPWAALRFRFNPHHRYLVRTERALFEHPALRAVICNSSLVENEIRDRFRIDPAKLHRIPNGVDLERFHPRVRSELRADMRLALGLSEELPVLLFVGSGFERKGLLFALRALADLPRAVQLVVLGRDKHSKRYEKAVATLGLAQRVHFKGEVPDPLPYLAAADALILPTLYDPFPNAVLEALACGLPVLTSNACGAIDVIRQAENGWIHRVADVAQLTSQLQDWLTLVADPSTRNQLSEAARQSVASYSTEALGTTLVALYEKLLDERR
jgi:UDP-glucose:(heptosyl)LPS alpha-1,3-glucosyltransferase